MAVTAERRCAGKAGPLRLSGAAPPRGPDPASWHKLALLISDRLCLVLTWTCLCLVQHNSTTESDISKSMVAAFRLMLQGED